MKKIIVFFLLVLVFLFTARSAVYANHRSKVLGISTAKISSQIPPTVEGPGLILPDSPLFFLDRIKQEVRVFLAYSSESKSEVYRDIAGERMAELRFMLDRENKGATRFTLQEISDNFQKATIEMNQAKLHGKNVSALAKKINDDIKLKQKSLDILEEQTEGEMKANVKATQESLMSSKIEVEDNLPEADLENELMDDINREISKHVDEAYSSAESISRAIEVLTREASDAAQKSQQRRQEALLAAIERKNENLRILEQRKLEAEKKKQEELIKVQAEAAVQAKKAVEEAKKAALKYQEAQKKAEELKTSNSTSVSSKED